MGCVLSKNNQEIQNVILICRERKRMMKSTVQNRNKFAESHCKYYHSLYAVSAAIRLFVARHSSPSSPFLISLSPPPQNQETNTTQISKSVFYHKHTQSEPTQNTISSNSPVFDQKHSTPVFGEEKTEWDFFINPFAEFEFEGVNVFNNQTQDEELREIREREGIPELEEEVEEEQGEKEIEIVKNEKNGEETEMSEWEKDSFRMIETGKNGRELFDVLKDVEDHFIRAYESGLEISQFLEVNVDNLQSSIQEIKESSNKLIQTTALRQTTYRSSSRKSFLASASINSSTLIEYNNGIFNDEEVLKPGSHSRTLERLYEWEKRLFVEVKAGDEIRKNYERKCARMGNYEPVEDGLGFLDKSSEEIKDLYTEILVAIRRAEKISEKIHILRDEELQPQIMKLLCGLMGTWKIMSDSHESQKRAILELKSFDLPTYGKYSNDSHRLATLQLEAELQNWHGCFVEFISSQNAYIESLKGWLSMFMIPKVEELNSTIRSCGVTSTPTLLVIFQNWSNSLKKLPEKEVKNRMKKIGKQIRTLWIQQGDEQQQKRKVEGIAKELDKRVSSFQKEETMIPISKALDKKAQMNLQNRVEYMTNKKNMLEFYRKKVDAEKARHHISMQETQRMTWNCFRTGFSSLFESLTEFSTASAKIYSDLVSYSENAEVTMIDDLSRK